MDATPSPQRALARLASLAVAATLAAVCGSACVVALVRGASGPSSDAVAATAARANTQPVALNEPAPLWPAEAAGPVASYRLPLADESIAWGPLQANRPTTPEPVDAFAYDPPPATRVARRPEPSPPQADAGWTGPLTIHNPAATGPPEDGSLPPIPTLVRPPRVATRPADTLDAPMLDAPSVGDRPTPSPALEEWLAVEPPPSESVTARAEGDPLVADASEGGSASLRELTVGAGDPVAPFTAAVAGLSPRLQPDVQAAFALGKAGAVYAARERFLGVLRDVAEAKDAAAGDGSHTAALDDALTTLRQAEDFARCGADLPANEVARSHGVRLEPGVRPHAAMARYAQHAATRFAEAAGGEPAGSMALYGLGKTYARIQRQSGEADAATARTAARNCLVVYRAAVAAHPSNFLAANELGVHLARAGHYEAAGIELRRAAGQPGAIAAVHENLAAVEQRLGRLPQAAGAAALSEQLAAAERATGAVSRRRGVEWVSPDALQRPGAVAAAPPIGPAVMPVAANQPMAPPRYANQVAPPLAAQPAPETPGGWSSVVRYAKRVTGWAEPTATVQQPTAVLPAMPNQAAPNQVVPMQRVLR